MELNSLLPIELPDLRARKGANRERPALRWYGGKFLLAPWVISHFPESYRELHYIEPYGGGGSVLLRKAPSVLETYNDLDSGVTSFFRVLRERPEELIHSLRLTPYSREEYQLSLLAYTGDDLELARLFFVRYWQSIGGTSSRSGWKVGRTKNGRYTSNPESFELSIGNLSRIAERLRGVQIENMEALELIQRADNPDSLFYIDPPYVMRTRANAFKSYAHELSNEDHIRLAEALRELSGYVLLSAYEDPLYEELYRAHDWASTSAETRANGGRIAKEILWINPRLRAELEERGELYD